MEINFHIKVHPVVVIKVLALILTVMNLIPHIR